MKLGQRFLYGSSRLGLITVDDDNVNGGADNTEYYYQDRDFGYDRGHKQYELTNHLGNVLATISDRKFGVSSGSSSLIDHYEPQVVSAQDYYPFGMLQPGRVFNTSGYRYGFNGKENDNEVKGEGNQQDYGMRIYDPRIGRWLSVDPLQKNYPDLTPYNFSGNSPIVFGDYGKDFGIIYDHKNKKVYIVGTYYVTKQEEAQATRALNDWNAKSAVGSDGYTVAFSLKTKVPEMQTKEEFIKSDASFAKLKKSEQEKKYKQYVAGVLWAVKENDPNGNAYYGSDFVNSTVQATASGSGIIGGVTNADYVYMNTGDDGTDFARNSDLVSHEFGHSLGLQDPLKAVRLLTKNPIIRMVV